MNRLGKVVIIVLCFLLSSLSLVICAMFINSNILNGMISLLVTWSNQTGVRNAILFISFLIFLLGIATMVYLITSDRLRKIRVRDSNLGVIDIGVDALESIALNATTAAQSGVKAAKARISASKDNKLRAHLNVMAYSDVELPAMMNKLQERVKKDIEKYTGIEVDSVEVKVDRVDAIAARVDR